MTNTLHHRMNDTVMIPILVDYHGRRYKEYSHYGGHCRMPYNSIHSGGDQFNVIAGLSSIRIILYNTLFPNILLISKTAKRLFNTIKGKSIQGSD